MARIAVFVDVSNIYYSLKSNYDTKLDYAAFVDYVKSLGDVVTMRAYGASLNPKKDERFRDYLISLGFDLKYKKPKTFHNNTGTRRKADWDITLAFDIIESIESFDTLVLVTADSDFQPLIERVQNNDKQVMVIGCKISNELKQLCNYYVEIPPRMQISCKS